MINLTPHAITISTAQGDVTIPPSGQEARVETVEEQVGVVEVNGLMVPVMKRRKGAVTGLPATEEDVLVSSMVLDAIPGYANVYAPDTGKTAIRNERGQVVVVTRLIAA